MPTEKQQAAIDPEKALAEFTPFGADSKVKLSIAIVKRLICVKTKSGKICSDEDAIKFMAMCQARKLNPFEGDAFLIGYDGREGPTFSLITAHQAFLKRAELNPEFDGMESGVVVEQDGEIHDIQGDFITSGQKLLGGWARVFFKNRSHPMYRRLRLERFKKPFGIWLDDSAGMIVKCAESDCLRSSFPTMLGGLYLREEKEARAIEILEPQISNGPSAGPAQDPPPSSVQPDPETTTAPRPQEPAAPPTVRKKSQKLKPKEEEKPKEPASPPTHREVLSKMLTDAGYNEDQFLAVCNRNEWLGKSRKWDSLNDVPDDMLELFTIADEWPTVTAQMAKLSQAQG